jgi:glycosyltransferase involved in cell wall biosynthesis
MSISGNNIIYADALKASTAIKASKVLIITYYWPPSGGAGVQRWLRFSRLLPELGWDPVILTVDPEYAVYPAVDNTLGTDMPESIEVYRTKATDWFRFYTKDKSKVPSAGFAINKDDSFKGKLIRFIRGNFFIPDPRRGWNKYAFRKASELIREKSIRFVITTSPPHSSQLIGMKIKKRFPRIKWISDLRDPWTDIYYYEEFFPTFLSRAIDSCYEKNVLKKSDKIITVGESLKKTFIEKVRGIESKTEVITNGYDNSDFMGKSPISPERFTITYVGTVSEAYPIGGLINVLGKIQNGNKKFILRFVGTVPETIKKKILSEISVDFIEFIPYSVHSEAISYMLNSSVLLLVIPDHKNNKNIITGKIFEYLASKKPILCLGPDDGDASKIILQNNFGKCFSYFDIVNIEAFITKAMAVTESEYKNTEEFSNNNLTKKLISLLH